MKLFKLALRSLAHFRVYTLINIVGLALSMVCVIILFRYVYSELTVEDFNSKIDRIYVSNAFPDNPTTQEYINSTPTIEDYTGFRVDTDMDVFYPEIEKRYNTNILVTYNKFFDIFDYELKPGGVIDVDSPDKALIFETFAEKVFPGQDPVGKQLRLKSGDNYTISGVLKTSEKKSLYNLDIVVNFKAGTGTNIMGDKTVILLAPGTDPDSIIIPYSYSDGLVRTSATDPENKEMVTYTAYHHLQPFKDRYFPPKDSEISSFSRGSAYNYGNKTTIITLSVVGILILLVGVFNFINIYTAVVLRRGREFGMKKVFGAGGKAVFTQLWAENAFMIVIALIVAMCITELTSPLVRTMLGLAQVKYVYFDILLCLGMILILPLITSIVPFIKYTFSPAITSLRSVGKTGGRGIGRRIMLVLQYVITFAMIIVSVFMVKQFHSMVNMDPGFKSEDIIITHFLKTSGYLGAQPERRGSVDIGKQIRKEIGESPLFTKWSFLGAPLRPGGVTSHNLNRLTLEGDTTKYSIKTFTANEEWLDVYEIEFLEKDFNWKEVDYSQYDFSNPEDREIMQTFTNRYSQFLLSESALEYFGITDWRNTTISYPMNPSYTRVYTINGVFKDFAIDHAGKAVEPIAIIYPMSMLDLEPMSLAVVSGRKQEAIRFLEDLHNRTIGGEFTYTTIEEEIRKVYAEDRKIATIYSIFTAVAILICALGLFSMSLFDVQQRRKEIGIRKVNGATTANILLLFFKRYFILLIVAFIISAPLATVAIMRYVENFAHKTQISWWIYAIAFILTAMISLLTLFHQAWKAANANPADVVRNE